ncbi:MAG TPA: response regulator [Stellaceae bacterium]|nr:response regulator [Stellaceae bacterium]
MARILWVEDEPDIRVLVENVLLAEGHAVDAAATLKEGSELLESADYDLVLVDGRLPDGTGIPLAEEAVAREIPALVMTAYAFILSELAANPGRYHFLLKPVRPDELIEAVDLALSRAA